MIRYRSRWVVPVSSVPIEDGVVAVDGDLIAFVGPRADAPAGDEVDLGESVLMPGLVNAHCHLELTVMRGFLEDLDFRRWIVRLTGARRAVLDRDALLDSARFGLVEGVRAGITTYADTCDSGVVLQAMREAGVRGVMYQEVFGPDPRSARRRSPDYARKSPGCATWRRRSCASASRPTRRTPYPTISFARPPRSRASSTYRWRSTSPRVSWNSATSWRVLDPSRRGCAGAASRWHPAPHRRCSSSNLGVLDVAPLLIHCVRVDGADIATIAGSASSVAHCPISNAKLGHGIAPLDEMLAAGVTVGLGSDSMASNNRMDLLEEARVALLAQRARVGSWETPEAIDVLELATIGGANALGLGDVIGTLDVGKQADLAAFSLDSVTPTFDPVTAAVFSLTGSSAHFVCVAGKPLLRDGKLVTSREGLADRMQALGRSLREWLSSGGEMGTVA